MSDNHENKSGSESDKESYDLMDHVVPDLERWVDHNFPGFPWEDQMDKIIEKHANYVHLLEHAVQADRTQRGLCAELPTHGVFCDKRVAAAGFCEDHYAQHKCLDCADVHEEGSDRCHSCHVAEQQAREARWERAVAEAHEKRQRQQENMNLLTATMADIVAHLPDTREACLARAASLNAIDIGVAIAEDRFHPAWLTYTRMCDAADVFSTNPDYARCMLAAWYPPPFNCWEFK